jgi:hypothetical protein
MDVGSKELLIDRLNVRNSEFNFKIKVNQKDKTFTLKEGKCT